MFPLLPMKGITMRGAKPIFSDEEEQALLKYLLLASDIYYGLSISELRALAFQYAMSIKCNYHESWNENKEASKVWYYSFMNRHPNLSLRKPQKVSQNRVKGKVDALFDNFVLCSMQQNMRSIEFGIWTRWSSPLFPTKS